MPVKIDEREYRNIDVDQMEIREAEDGKMIVEGYATTFDKPYRLMSKGKITVFEQMDRNAFAETDTSDTILQYNHDGPVFARISNGTLAVMPDEYGLKVTADLSGTERGRQLFEEIRGGYITKMSIGFNIPKNGDKNIRSKDADGNTIITRTIMRVKKLFDVSAVSQPANDTTEISARSIGDGLIAEAEKEIQAEEERARKIGEIRKILKGEQNHDE